MASYVLQKIGETTNITIPTKSTTTYAEAEWLYNDGTNDVPATTTSQKLRGIVRQAKVSAANTNPIVISVPVSVDAAFEMDVGTGTIAATDVGKSYDLASSTTVNASASTYKPLTLVKFITTTKGWFSVNYAEGVNAA